MAKFYGSIGFCVEAETTPGVWDKTVTVRKYRGDVLRNVRKLQSADKVNDDVNIANQISIVADPYLTSNYFAIEWIEFMGAKWKIESVEVQRPRLLLTIGGLYNGPQT